ncbi:hypothetical protein XENTR_v10008257 [Xenopus tropicalis]|nr:hypothetical protein XENTR_v10008257 [Xenopus tropicalis]
MAIPSELLLQQVALSCILAKLNQISKTDCFVSYHAICVSLPCSISISAMINKALLTVCYCFCLPQIYGKYIYTSICTYSGKCGWAVCAVCVKPPQLAGHMIPLQSVYLVYPSSG